VVRKRKFWSVYPDPVPVILFNGIVKYSSFRMQPLNETRVGTLLQTILYLTGVPVFIDENGYNTGIDGRGRLSVDNIIPISDPDGKFQYCKPVNNQMRVF